MLETRLCNLHTFAIMTQDRRENYRLWAERFVIGAAAAQRLHTELQRKELASMRESFLRFGMQNVFWQHAFGSFDHNSWGAQGAVRSVARRFVYTFLRKLPVCPQIRPLFYPQIAGGSTDLSTNCHFCPQACPHFCPQIIMSVRTLVRRCPQCCPQRAAFVRRFVHKLCSSGCKVERRVVHAWPPLSADLFA